MGHPGSVDIKSLCHHESVEFMLTLPLDRPRRCCRRHRKYQGRHENAPWQTDEGNLKVPGLGQGEEVITENADEDESYQTNSECGEFDDASEIPVLNNFSNAISTLCLYNLIE
jgi:hypothetical protein